MKMIAPDYAPNVNPFTQAVTVPTGGCAPNPHVLLDTFSLSELHKCLSSSRDCAPGPDLITNSMIKRLPSNAISLLLRIFNMVYNAGYIPSPWKEFYVLPIHKPGKPPLLPSSYRPIALRSNIAKLFEKLIKNRLVWWLEHYSLVRQEQYGFRSGIGTVDAISYLYSRIQQAFQQKEILGALFMDISSAFDNVQLHILQQKLISLGIPLKLNKILHELFAQRLYKPRMIHNGPYTRQVFQGLVQGSSLSPILFLIYTQDLIFHLGPYVRLIAYADDIVLWYQGPTFQDVSAKLAVAITSANKWLTAHGMSLSLSKTHLVYFTKKRYSSPLPTPSLEGHTFPVISQVKYLGVIFDRTLNGIGHINYVINKCYHRIQLLKALTANRWGADIHTLRSIFLATVRTNLIYGCILLQHISKTQAYRLEKVQNEAMRIILGAFKSTPIIYLQVELGILPLTLYRPLTYCKHWTHLHQTKLTSLKRLMDRVYEIPLSIKRSSVSMLPAQIQSNFSYDYACHHYTPTVTIFGGKDVSPIALRQMVLEMLAQYPDSTHLYTDGSKTSTGTGAAWFDKTNHKTGLYQLPTYITIYLAEAFAIYQALTYILNCQIKAPLILSDSASVLTSLQSFRTPAELLILEIKKLCLAIRQYTNEPVFLWIPSHTGVHSNEIVDNLATMAITQGVPMYPRSPQLLQPLIKAHYHSLMISQLTQLSAARSTLYHELHGTTFKVISHYPLSSHRHRAIISFRLRSDHNSSPAHLYKLGIIDSAGCSCGNPYADMRHILLECPNFVDRQKMYQDLRKLGLPFPLSYPSMLYHHPHEVCQILIDFILRNHIHV
ncbi:uncharacterized protein LOC134527548 isoform X1 [Bacillus rossius redtenbacheri]|uniref:uncharacterized protein LOC134527548 isoform X1 n=1 Tax=Bacillus rossius redtenbacheri TaxID=93214 RepID=UPI002FDEDC17